MKVCFLNYDYRECIYCKSQTLPSLNYQKLWFSWSLSFEWGFILHYNTTINWLLYFYRLPGALKTSISSQSTI